MIRKIEQKILIHSKEQFFPLYDVKNSSAESIKEENWGLSWHAHSLSGQDCRSQFFIKKKAKK